MPKVVIADTSCLIVLTKIERLDLLQEVYQNITITQEIAHEFGEELPTWLEVVNIQDTYRLKLLEMQIDKGEASAITLALETMDTLIILDDHKARLIAESLGLKVTGTLGVLIMAKQMGLLSSIKPILARIKETNFRISPELEEKALKEAGEI